MADRPYTVLSCSMSLDGYLAGTGERRLMLSNDADFDRVDAVRAACDAILVGAETVRKDNPRLVIRSELRRQERIAAGRPESPLKATVTGSGRLDPDAAFFSVGSGQRLVYGGSAAIRQLRERLTDRATLIDGGDCVDMRWLSRDLHARGVSRLMVEGGGILHTQFLTADLVDELHLVVAPFFVGNSAARRFVGDGHFPFHAGRRAELLEARQLGDVVLLRYALSERCDG